MSWLPRDWNSHVSQMTQGAMKSVGVPKIFPETQQALVLPKRTQSLVRTSVAPAGMCFSPGFSSSQHACWGQNSSNIAAPAAKEFLLRLG